MSIELVNPYINKELYTNLELYPHQMNSELYLNLKKNLKKKLEGKCNKYGYINKIIKISKYSDGIIDAENFSGNGVYNISYIANICIPLVNTIIIVRVENLNKYLILGINGPLNVIINISEIKSDIFSINTNGVYIDSLNKNIEVGDYLKIVIDGIKFSPGDNKIGILGNLINIPSPEEIEEYNNNNNNKTDEYEEKVQTIVEINDDIEYITETKKKSNFNEI
jgi:DNA-directed RNA polymerase subunit E'/Rpb7